MAMIHLPDRKFDIQFKTTFYKTCGATAICGYPFDQDALCSAFNNGLNEDLHQIDLDKDETVQQHFGQLGPARE